MVSKWHKTTVLLGIFLILLSACTKSNDEKLYKRLVDLESEFWFQHSTTQVLLNRILGPETQIVWSTNFHTAAPVPIGAVGPEKYTQKLKGIIQNDSIGRVLKDAVKNDINVILVIGDGMGNMHMALPIYKRYAENNHEQTMFEKIMKEGTCGYVYTCTANGLVTCSAAAGTAIACGTKTMINMVGVDPDGHKLESALALAKKLNYKTALVSNANLTDATPAVFYAHSYDRDLENQIATELLSSNIVDVALGGGGNHFIPKGKKLTDCLPNEKSINFASERNDTVNLIQGFLQKGYNMCFNLDEMRKAPIDKPLLGFFSGGGLPAVIDMDESTANIPRVEDMARKALEIISAHNQPYFTMIECGRIDWEAHDNDAVAVYQAVEGMNRVLEVAYSFYKKNPEKTLLVFTADHETGGLEIAYRKMPENQAQHKQLSTGEEWINVTNPLSYEDYVRILDRQKKAVPTILAMSHNVEDIQKNFKKYMGIDLSDEDAKLMYYSRNNYKRYKDK
jgi:alkaline phosphatase